MTGVGHLRSLSYQSSAVGSTDRRRFGRPRSTPGTCRAERRGVVPKLEPFSRGRIEHIMKDPPFLMATEKNFRDYCSVLEGEECCRCWEAYFEFKHLEEKMSKEDLEKLVRGAGCIKTLIGTVRGLSRIFDEDKGKAKDEMQRPPTAKAVEEQRSRPFPIPDGIPKTKEELEELEEEQRALLPDTPWTRILRARGRMPDWYTPRPDHETD